MRSRCDRGSRTGEGVIENRDEGPTWRVVLVGRLGRSDDETAVLKTAGSSFENFYHDEYTTLVGTLNIGIQGVVQK